MTACVDLPIIVFFLSKFSIVSNCVHNPNLLKRVQGVICFRKYPVI